MFKILILDIATVIAATTGTGLLLIRWRKTSLKFLFFFTGIFFTTYGSFSAFLTLKWSGLSRNLESFEDLTGAILPLLWFIIFYILIETVRIKKLAQNEERLQLVIQSANLGVWDWDIKTDHLSLNKRWGEMLGYTTREITPNFSAWKHLVHPDDFAATMVKFNDHLTSKTPFYEAEFRMRHKNGNWRWIAARGKIVERDDLHTPLRATGIHLDVTDKKLMEQELKQSNEEYLALNEELSESYNHLLNTNTELKIARAKAEEGDHLKTAFLNNLSHEIRTPMNGILGFTQLLKDPNLIYDKQTSYIQAIEQSGRRLMKLINSLIDISKIEEGQIDITLKTTSIDNMLEELYQFFKPQAEENDLTLIYKKKPSINFISAPIDRDRIMQVFTNLLDNAIKFTRSGQIVFGYNQTANTLDFFVKDTGIGIAAEMHKIIFERFRQVDNSFTRGYEGTGLGLSISKAIIELHGGKMWVNSILGKGATFYFSIPCTPTKKHTSSHLRTTPLPPIPISGKNKILIAEDDEISFLLLNDLLTQNNFNILHAKTGTEAIRLVDKYPDTALIFMDIKIPEMNGLEVTKTIKAKYSNIPIVAQTAYAREIDKQRAMEAGCDDFITKPIDNKSIETIILKYFGSQKP